MNARPFDLAVADYVVALRQMVPTSTPAITLIFCFKASFCTHNVTSWFLLHLHLLLDVL